MKTMKVLLPMIFVTMQVLGQRDSVRLKNLAYFIIANEGCLCGIQNSDVNSILKNNGFPSLSKNMVSVNFGFGITIDRLSFQFLLKQYRMFKQSNDNTSTTGQGIGSEVRVQYNIMKPGRIYLSPYAGFGRQDYEFRFDSQSPRNLNSALQAGAFPANSSKLDSYETIVTTGVSVGIIKRKATTRLGYKLGLQAGYQFAGNGAWRLNDELVQGPNSSFGGIDIKIEAVIFCEFSRRK